MTETTKAYIAGFIDGEGCIRISRNKYKSSNVYEYKYGLILQVTNTIKEPIFLIQSLYGGCLYEKQDKRPNRRRTYNLNMTTQNAIKLIEDIFPYLIVKKVQAQIAIEFSHTIKYSGKALPLNVYAKRQELCFALSELNQRRLVYPKEVLPNVPEKSSSY